MTNKRTKDLARMGILFKRLQAEDLKFICMISRRPDGEFECYIDDGNVDIVELQQASRELDKAIIDLKAN